jgi:hypothetical protein
MSKKNLATVLFKNSDLLKFHKVKFYNFSLVLYEQSGGGKQLTIDYNGTKYKFKENPIDPDHWFLTSSEGDDCVFVIIDRPSGVAEIHGIGNYKSCLADTNTNIGSTLLKITLKMLYKYKEKLGIKLIVLTDNSIKYCKNKEIKLALMLTLLTGDTWYGKCCKNNTCPKHKNSKNPCLYGKYGFRPVIRSLNSYAIDKTDLDHYEKNKQIMSQVKITDIDLIKYISLTKNDKLIKAVVQLIKSNPNMLIKDFLTNFIRDYDSTCDLFYEFYEKLYVKLGLFGFYRYLFGLYL